ncbi:hypothetical protein COCNU_03G007340 [Cocos nucifera]|uniref:PHD-type zinc finger plants domain-containing protein n=1 Tax=Cocos nucifera TaxID=13894 RepID=A0A8K0MYM1_COCNU|nr:hypothetical protein COCNU_03G007340 [Cocos nucifera]
MGSKGGASSPSSVVCCMCGDHGLRQELFRCKVCLVRSQHKYCSNLYPKADSYRACNWCLREEGGKSLSKETATDHNSSISSTSANADNTSAGGGSGGKLHRGAFSSQLNKPIKKQRLLDRSTSDVTDRIPSEELSPSSGRGRQVFRGKVRRYKLLEEVSS